MYGILLASLRKCLLSLGDRQDGCHNCLTTVPDPELDHQANQVADRRQMNGWIKASSKDCGGEALRLPVQKAMIIAWLVEARSGQI